MSTSSLSIAFNNIGVVKAVPNTPPLLAVVQGAATSVSFVPTGTVPLAIRAVSSRCVPPGTMDETFTYISEFDTEVMGAPAIGLVKVRLTGALFVAIKL
ncbi:hypothetical protein SDC9_106276 [bioreactor metagenome]|uniref:Uncharacterized protein n=1 Tax=bioreactor metagenome TaxID=1076179 RepID=A0A645BCJ9_9ZZZZ